ncbi:MAG: quinolinate synthase NadA [Myxococcales bacterium]|nr:quinolinate synthase NadA [Myxococcales bacterium]
MDRPVFPTLRIFADRLEARGAFAEAQAAWLRPDPALVARLDAALAAANVGVVAHFYMDPELQGVLTACTWPHIHISDSLVMADRAVAMAEAGVSTICVLGVDFMSENVRAMLDAAGHTDVGVYRVATDPIGCSLAEAAEARAYGAYLTEASETPNALHVIYINTSLRTKAKAQHLVPTLTCTSSNVVQSVLQAFAQVPDLTLFFGPDTYMGGNLRSMFERYAQLPDAEIAALHPAHNRASLRRVLAGLRIFEQGTCIVHHLFGRDVVQLVRDHYSDAFISAHLEVPGEMFALAAELVPEGRGVVGSTSNILSFINARIDETTGKEPIAFVLGTEAGMITPIVRDVQAKLAKQGTGGSVDIVFPVSGEAIAQTDDLGLGIVPGVAGGEGCSTAGGCATCPFMKMNRLDRLFDVIGLVKTGASVSADLQAFAPQSYPEQIGGQTVAQLGSQPIIAMREFGRTGQLPASLITDVMSR